MSKKDFSTESEKFPSLHEVKKIITPSAYSDEELAELLESDRVQNMIKWIQKLNPNDVDDLPVLDHVTAYPNYTSYLSVPGQHNLNKWLDAVKEIVTKERNGVDYKMALSQATNGWQPMEILDFINWLKYYQEGAHVKYKFAQYYYGDLNNGYMIPIKKNVTEEPETNISFSPENVSQDVEKKQMIEKQRNKILSRLDSVEKLLRSKEGESFSGNEQNSFLEAIHDLKRKVLQFNKQSLSYKTYDDLIIRQANILYKNGFVKASNWLHSLAEENNADTLPPAAPPAMPTQSSGTVGGLPSMGPGMPQTPPESAESNEPENISPAVNKLIQNLNFEDNSDSDTDDILEVDDSEELLTVEAQLAPPPPAPPPPIPPVDEKSVPVSETEEKIEVEEPAQESAPHEFDSKIDAAFSNLKVSDVVVKLEDLAKLFKVREVPRQLAIVDMMLDSLGLASYFPSLSEATNKALESNNYISTRIEDILSKLRGAMKTHDIDLRGEEKEENQEVSSLKNKLQEDEDKEKARKQMRKEQEAQELESKETPEIEVEEDLTPPVPVPPAPAPPAPKPVI